MSSEHFSEVCIDAQTYEFDDHADAHAFADELCELICKWLPWSQAILGPFATVERKER